MAYINQKMKSKIVTLGTENKNDILRRGIISEYSKVTVRKEIGKILVLMYL